MFSEISYGKADAFLGGGIVAGAASFIPGLKDFLQIILLLIGCASGLASAYYYVTAARNISRKANREKKE